VVDEVLRGGKGSPLSPALRAYFEPRFGRDFGDVRVHTDSRAAASARAVDAHAYTVGQNIVFDAGRYAPGSAGGKRLIAHELAHVVQQSGTARPNVIRRKSASGEINENQLARPKVTLSTEGHDDIIVINGIRTHRVRHVEAGKPVQRISGGGGTYVRLRGKEFSRGGSSVAWEWSIPLVYRHPVLVDEIPAGIAAVQKAFPSVVFTTRPAVQVDMAELERQVAEKRPRAKLAAMAQEVGTADLDQGISLPPSPFDKKSTSADPWQAASDEETRRYSRAHLRQMIAGGLSLADSVARSHFRSRAELEAFTREYSEVAAEISSEHGKRATADRDAIDEAILEVQTGIILKHQQRADGTRRVEGTIGQLRIATPEFLKPTRALGQYFAIPLIKGVDDALDFVPYVGVAKMLLEAISGRTLSGQIDQAITTGRGFFDLAPDLDVTDRIIHIIPFAIDAAVRIVAKAPGWIEAIRRMKQLSGMSDGVLKLKLADMASLRGSEPKLIRALLKLRQARRAAAQRVKDVVTAPGYMMMSSGGLGGFRMRGPKLTTGGGLRSAAMAAEAEAAAVKAESKVVKQIEGPTTPSTAPTAIRVPYKSGDRVLSFDNTGRLLLDGKPLPVTKYKEVYEKLGLTHARRGHKPGRSIVDLVNDAKTNPPSFASGQFNSERSFIENAERAKVELVVQNPTPGQGGRRVVEFAVEPSTGRAFMRKDQVPSGVTPLLPYDIPPSHPDIVELVVTKVRAVFSPSGEIVSIFPIGMP